MLDAFTVFARLGYAEAMVHMQQIQQQAATRNRPAKQERHLRIVPDDERKEAS